MQPFSNYANRGRGLGYLVGLDEVKGERGPELFFLTQLLNGCSLSEKLITVKCFLTEKRLC